MPFDVLDGSDGGTAAVEVVTVDGGAAAIEWTARSMPTQTTNRRRRKPHNGGIRFGAGAACAAA